jgi:hypothetical protein
MLRDVLTSDAITFSLPTLGKGGWGAAKGGRRGQVEGDWGTARGGRRGEGCAWAGRGWSAGGMVPVTARAPACAQAAGGDAGFCPLWGAGSLGPPRAARVRPFPEGSRACRPKGAHLARRNGTSSAPGGGWVERQGGRAAGRGANWCGGRRRGLLGPPAVQGRGGAAAIRGGRRECGASHRRRRGEKALGMPPPAARRGAAPIWPHAPVTRYLWVAWGSGSPWNAPRPVNM